MKTIISLGLAVALSSSPVVELGATVAKAQSLKDAELSSQNANTNYCRKCKIRRYKFNRCKFG